MSLIYIINKKNDTKQNCFYKIQSYVMGHAGTSVKVLLQFFIL